MPDPLLNPNNHELYAHVRLMAIARNPTLSWEEIAARIGLEETEVNELLAWFLSYRLPPSPKSRVRPAGMVAPRDPTERAEYFRLVDRESSLLTTVSQAPVQLARVQMRMDELERPAPRRRING